MKSKILLLSFESLVMIATLTGIGGCVVARKYETEKTETVSRPAPVQRKEMSDIRPLIEEANQSLHFDFNSSELSIDARAELYKLGDRLAQDPKAILHIDGYTDDRGSAHYNQHLSDRRAATVSEVLLSRGVLPAQIHTFGKGEIMPGVSQPSESLRAKNRKVEINLGQSAPQG